MRPHLCRRFSCTLSSVLLAAALGCRDDGAVPTSPESQAVPATGALAVTLSFRQVSAGFRHTCGVTTGDKAYCWGDNGEGGPLGGQLGDGTTIDRLIPVPVAGGHSFRQVSAGVDHSCGVTTDNHGYCWGNNSNYQIGDGTSTSFSRPKPVLVAGGLSFRALSAGSGYISPAGDPSPDDALSCSVTTTNRAYCWGSGSTGNLFGSATPVEVAGGRRYITVSAGTQGCGVTLAGGLYCWGHSAPVHVPAGGLRFTGVSVSGIGSHTCAISTEDRAYCWGDNSQGQLGDGTTSPREKPVAVGG